MAKQWSKFHIPVRFANKLVPRMSTVNLECVVESGPNIVNFVTIWMIQHNIVSVDIEEGSPESGSETKPVELMTPTIPQDYRCRCGGFSRFFFFFFFYGGLGRSVAEDGKYEEGPVSPDSYCQSDKIVNEYKYEWLREMDILC